MFLSVLYLLGFYARPESMRHVSRAKLKSTISAAMTGAPNNAHRRSACILAPEFLGDLALKHFYEVAGHIGVEDFRVNIAFTAYRRRVSELPSYLLDRHHHIALGFRLTVVFPEFGQSEGGKHRPCPCPEILSR